MAVITCMLNVCSVHLSTSNGCQTALAAVMREPFFLVVVVEFHLFALQGLLHLHSMRDDPSQGYGESGQAIKWCKAVQCAKMHMCKKNVNSVDLNNQQ